MLTDGVGCLEELHGSGILADEYIAQVLRQACDEMSCVEALDEYLVEQQERIADMACEGSVDETEIVVRVEHIEHLDGLLVADIIAAEGNELVKYTKRIAHTSVGLLCDHIECFFADIDAFEACHILEVANGIGHSDAAEVIDLASAEDGR